MKTLRFFGVCLLASLLCVNFSACGGEDTPEPENPGNNPSNPTVGPGNGSSSNEKRLVKMEFIDDYKMKMEDVFGQGSFKVLSVRKIFTPFI